MRLCLAITQQETEFREDLADLGINQGSEARRREAQSAATGIELELNEAVG